MVLKPPAWVDIGGVRYKTAVLRPDRALRVSDKPVIPEASDGNEGTTRSWLLAFVPDCALRPLTAQRRSIPGVIRAMRRGC